MSESVNTFWSEDDQIKADDGKCGTIEWGGYVFDIYRVKCLSGKINLQARKHFDSLDDGVLTGDLVVRGIDGGVILRAPMGPTNHGYVRDGFLTINVPISLG